MNSYVDEYEGSLHDYDVSHFSVTKMQSTYTLSFNVGEFRRSLSPLSYKGNKFNIYYRPNMDRLDYTKPEVTEANTDNQDTQFVKDFQKDLFKYTKGMLG